MKLGTLATETTFAQVLLKDVLSIERGYGLAWNHFAGFLDAKPGLDGEHAEIYGAACAEIFRRDPTFFLRRYLRGDERALICAGQGFGWSSPGSRKCLVELHRTRLKLEPDEKGPVQRRVSQFLDVISEISVQLKAGKTR